MENRCFHFATEEPNSAGYVAMSEEFICASKCVVFSDFIFLFGLVDDRSICEPDGWGTVHDWTLRFHAVENVTEKNSKDNNSKSEKILNRKAKMLTLERIHSWNVQTGDDGNSDELGVASDGMDVSSGNSNGTTVNTREGIRHKALTLYPHTESPRRIGRKVQHATKWILLELHSYIAHEAARHFYIYDVASYVFRLYCMDEEVLLQKNT